MSQVTGHLPKVEEKPDNIKEECQQSNEPKQKKTRSKREVFEQLRDSALVNLLFTFLVPLITTITLEWIARGTLGGNIQSNGFFESLLRYMPSFLISYLLLVVVYLFISQLTGKHFIATIVVGLLGNVPAVVTYYKLTMRAEPFLPWDLGQIDDLAAMGNKISYDIQPSMVITLVIFVLLTVLACFVKVPLNEYGKQDLKLRFSLSGIALAMALFLMFGVFLNPVGTAILGIREDMWMQDRYYRKHGVLTGFLTNLQMMQIDKPDGYSKEKVDELANNTLNGSNGGTPYFGNSYATETANPVQDPDIIFLMAESFWDVTRLPGIVYDQPLLTNLNQLKQEAATGWGYSPSFGGGTCDVEFEALTGFSVEHLPSGSKPFQQYVTDEMFSLPSYLKTKGYETLGIHGYGRRFWSRDTAYPRLGIDTFLADDDFEFPTYRRGYISDDAMVEKIIEQHQQREDGGPMFIHAVTMQNHTTYDPVNYPPEDLVQVLEHPEAMPKSTVGQLQDCATGIREMDAAVGKLVEYLRTTDRPTILVFWGDHLNPMSDGYAMFEDTGFIEEGDTSSPLLHEVPLMMWSNYATNQVDLGTLATYNIGPAMMDLYGLEQPVMFEFLRQNLNIMHGRTRGITVEADGTTSQEMNEEQQQLFDEHAVLQYDLMFGNRYLEEYFP